MNARLEELKAMHYPVYDEILCGFYVLRMPLEYIMRMHELSIKESLTLEEENEYIEFLEILEKRGPKNYYCLTFNLTRPSKNPLISFIDFFIRIICGLHSHYSRLLPRLL